jgi:hypothetical protein
MLAHASVLQELAKSINHSRKMVFRKWREKVRFESNAVKRNIQKFRNTENTIGLCICLIQFYRQVDEVEH